MDRMFFASFAFCAIAFEPIMIQTCSAPQNDRQNFSFVKDTYVDGEKLARNGRKTATYYAASFLPHYTRVLFSHLLVFNLWVYAVKEYQKMFYEQLMPLRSKKTINSGKILSVFTEIITEQNKSHLYKWMNSQLPDFISTLIILTTIQILSTQTL